MAAAFDDLRRQPVVLAGGLAGLAAGAILLRTCCKQAAPKELPKGVRYVTMTNTEYNFAIRHPVGWTVNEYSQRGSIVFQFIHPERPDVMIELVLEELRDQIDLALYAEQARSNTVTQLQTLQEFTIREEAIPENRIVSIKDHETSQWQISMLSNEPAADEQAGLHYRTWNCVCLHGCYGWGLLVSTNSVDFDETMLYAKTMAGSLVFTA
eukprot:TRINITY_DN25765_c0_g1_i1.p1 TRINITY_DN25765_c0_g1~~TRINITY_DN25765_c0_g1_i1.p1  ORF type:complete len:227 (+),score=80.36 TRINITY_DN25765_c0_g1_i1:52-681(+)